MVAMNGVKSEGNVFQNEMGAFEMGVEARYEMYSFQQIAC